MACLWSPTKESKQASSTLAINLVLFEVVAADSPFTNALQAWEYCLKAISQCRTALSRGSLSGYGDAGGDSFDFSNVLYKAPSATTA
jgi:hypothetical protein